MKNGRVVASAVVLALGVIGAFTPARANLIVNGSFEADPFTSGTPGQRLGLVGNDVTGWFIPASDGIYPWGLQNVNPYGAGPAADGNQWLVLGEVSSGIEYSIQQTLHGLVSGNTYALTFDIASEASGTGSSTAEVSFLSGSSTAAQDFVAPAVGLTYWNPWGSQSMNFLATSSDVTLQFKDVNLGPGDDLGLDNVVVNGVTSVPEPGTLALLGTGLMAAFAAARRRRKANA